MYTDSEKEIMLNTRNDLKAIASNNNYLIYKYNKLSDDRKKEIMYYINMFLMEDSTAIEVTCSCLNEETCKTKNSITKEAVIDDAHIFTVCVNLPDHMRKEVYARIYELFQLEPSYKGRRGQLWRMYKRLSPLSKRIVSDHIYKLIEANAKAPERHEKPCQSNFKSAIIIDFQSRKAVREEASL